MLLRELRHHREDRRADRRQLAVERLHRRRARVRRDAIQRDSQRGDRRASRGRAIARRTGCMRTGSASTSACPDARSGSRSDAHQRLAGDEARREQHAARCSARRVGVAAGGTLARDEIRDEPAERRSARSARAAGRCRRRRRAPARANARAARLRVLVERDDRGADHARPIAIMPHGSPPPNTPFATEAMRVACGASSGFGCSARRHADAVGLRRAGSASAPSRARARDDADREHHLLPPRRRAEQLAGLEVLQVVAADRRPRSRRRRRS